MQIDHKLRQRTVQMSYLTFHHDKTGTGQFNRCSKIKTGVHLAERNMVTNFKVELTWRTPTFHFNVVVFIFTHRNAIVRNVWDRQRDITDFRLQRFQLGFCRIQLFTQFVHFQA